jgi:hypothetical protein
MGDGACDAGAFVHNGTVCGTGGWVPMLGSTIDGRWVVGTVDDSMGAQLAEAIPGFGWLVRDGATVPGLNDSYVAPRTTAGVTKGGQVRAEKAARRRQCLLHPRSACDGRDSRGPTTRLLHPLTACCCLWLLPAARCPLSTASTHRRVALQLLLLEVDGCEPSKGCKEHYGLTLVQVLRSPLPAALRLPAEEEDRCRALQSACLRHSLPLPAPHQHLQQRQS